MSLWPLMASIYVHNDNLITAYTILEKTPEDKTTHRSKVLQIITAEADMQTKNFNCMKKG